MTSTPDMNVRRLSSNRCEFFRRVLFILTMCCGTSVLGYSDHAGLLWRPKISFPVDPTSPTVPDLNAHLIDEAVDEAQTIIVQQKLFERAARKLNVIEQFAEIFSLF